MLPCAFSKGERDLRSPHLVKQKEVKENEKVCVQAEGKPSKFQSSLILLHLVWESCIKWKENDREENQSPVVTVSGFLVCPWWKTSCFPWWFSEGRGGQVNFFHCWVFAHEVLSAHLCCPSGMLPLQCPEHFSLLFHQGLDVSLNPPSSIPSYFPSPTDFQRSSHIPSDYLVVLAGSSAPKPCIGKPDASTNCFLNG